MNDSSSDDKPPPEEGVIRRIHRDVAARLNRARKKMITYYNKTRRDINDREGDIV